MRSQDLQPTFNAVVHKTLKPLLLGLSAITALLVLVGIYYYDGRTSSLVILYSDVLFAVSFAVLYLISNRFITPANAHPWGFAIGMMALFNALLAFVLQKTPFLLSYIPIIVLGFGAFMLSMRWLIFGIATIVVATGAATMAILPASEYVLYAPILMATCVFSVLIMVVRRWGFASAHEAMLTAEFEAQQRKEVEEQLAQAQRLDSLGRLVSGVAHDFNNLMMVVIGYSESLLETSADGHTRSGLQQIRKAGESAAGLAGKLLAFSRQQVLQAKVLDTNDVVESARGLIAKSLPSKIQLHLNLHPDSGSIKADPMQMEQVLLNLALNARDAMEGMDDGVLTISTEPGYMQAPGKDAEAPAAVIAVTDTGSGMSEEVQRLAFEPFFTTKAADRGTGLGLASVHGIISQSGGTVEIESQEGVGTTFRIELPRVVDADKHAPARAEAHKPLSGYTLLVVDDEAEVREVIATTLESHGCEVIAADSGHAALEAAAQSSFNAVLTDIVMPDMSGIDLAAELEARGFERPVIFMSGNAAQVASRAPGMVSKTPFISKPFRATELIQIIRETLARSEQSSNSAVA